jgi:large subunit ribosomal protein L22
MENNIVQAKSKYIRISPRKARLVIDFIRGMNALEASAVLQYTNKKAALSIKKCLDSAIANAENNHDMNKENLVVVEARIDEAPTLKRGLAVARGRYHQILKRASHIIIKVAEKDSLIKKETKNTNKDSKKASKVVKSETPKAKEEKEEGDSKKESKTKKQTKKPAAKAIKKSTKK